MPLVSRHRARLNRPQEARDRVCDSTPTTTQPGSPQPAATNQRARPLARGHFADYGHLMDRERLPIASGPDHDHVPPGVGGHVYPVAGGSHHPTPRRTFSGRSRGAPAAARYCPSSVRLPYTWPTLAGRPLAKRPRRRSRPDATVNATPPDAFGHFPVRDPPPERLLIAERLRRRMRMRFADEWIADSEDVEAGAVAIDSRKEEIRQDRRRRRGAAPDAAGGYQGRRWRRARLGDRSPKPDMTATISACH